MYLDPLGLEVLGIVGGGDERRHARSQSIPLRIQLFERHGLAAIIRTGFGGLQHLNLLALVPAGSRAARTT